jgi:hypothetical protein
MSAVAEGLVGGSATTTQGDAGYRSARLPIGLLNIRNYFGREIIQKIVRAVGKTRYLGLLFLAANASNAKSTIRSK